MTTRPWQVGRKEDVGKDVDKLRLRSRQDYLEKREAQKLEALKVSDLPCNIRREGGQSLVIGGPSLVMLEGREGNPL